ncbi:hypothetical protein [Calditerricola satsumensis]|uniref:Uncharacterized protein n=1 Tax=Calditerricola satsumensis TaxID=373054 RepID=A0A8J3FFN1_9BACI|nr:hypothetical protein [Calditerricola satsumensis]GGK05619.1 hypothetical protein GCM10007043_19580 [Calditerricola satsumensis]
MEWIDALSRYGVAVAGILVAAIVVYYAYPAFTKSGLHPLVRRQNAKRKKE